MRVLYALAFACLLIFATSPTTAANRGMISPGGVSVHEPGQKAIIAWNDEREVLILSTDVLASENTWVLELLPLPSQPESPEAGSFDSFIKIQDMLWTHTTDVYTLRGLEPPSENAIEVIFHENIGAHNITIVSTAGAQALVDFAENLLEAKGLTEEVSWAQLENPAASYLHRGMDYWVLDLIDLSDYLLSREPVIYSFESDCLYFPLEITSLASGETEITLFTLMSEKLDAKAVETAGFSIASFIAGENAPIELRVSREELQEISPRVAELFGGEAWLTALTYSGPLENLEGDLTLFAVAAPPVGEANLRSTLAWAAATVGVLLAIFAIFYKTSAYYKTGPGR